MAVMHIRTYVRTCSTMQLPVSIIICISLYIQGQAKGYLNTLQIDPDITSAVSKVVAHLETSARHCQSLKNKFLSFSFVWEQDVEESFDLFLKGKYASRGHRLTGAQTVRASAWSSHGRLVQCHAIRQGSMASGL